MKPPTAKPPSAEFLEAAAQVSRAAAAKFSWGFHSSRDIHQEAWRLCLEAWPKYDETRKPSPFLRKHVWNRLRNLYRNQCRRSDAPCKGCHSGVPPHPGGVYCDAYLEWAGRNDAKAALLNLVDPEAHPSEMEDALVVDDSQLEDVHANELASLIDAHLPAELRSDYARMLANAKVRPARRLMVQEAVRAILERYCPTSLPDWVDG